MADTSIHPRRNVGLDPAIREAFCVEEEDQLAREWFIAQLRLLWQQRRFVFRVVICGVVAATLIAFLIPARYISSVRLMPPDNRAGLALAAVSLSGHGGSLGSSLLGDLGSDLIGIRSTSELFVGILRSRTLEDHLIAQFNLKHVYIEDARKELENHTDISVDRKSQIVIIKVTDKDRDRAAAMARKYVDELNRAVAEMSTSSARRERIFLEGRLKEVKEDLESAEKDLSQYASKNTTIDIKEQGKAMVEAAANLQGQLIVAQSRLQEMRQIYTSNNVRVRGLQARIAELQNQLNKIGGKGEGLSAPSGQEDDSLYPSIRKLPLLGVTWADLYRRVRVQEVVFETLTQQYELSRVEEAKEIPTVKVLDAPDVPEKKSSPPRILIIASGAFLSILVAFGWVVGVAKWQQIDPRDPGKALAEEVVATVKSNILLVRRNGSGPSKAAGPHA
jgi:capsule polysaccharide export protein KpsE/RkpR